MKRLLAFTFSILLCLNMAVAIGYPFSPGDPELSQALDYLKGQQKDDGSIGGFGVSPWIVMAISASGEDPNNWKKSSTAPSIVDYLRNNANQIDENDPLEWGKLILAITAAYENPADFGGLDYVAKLKSFYDNIQIGDSSSLNDDFWGILALISAGENKSSEIIQTCKNYILDNQNSDGGWSYGTGLSSDVDNTAAAILALVAAGVDNDSDIILNGLSSIKSHQNNDGGFPFLPGTGSNSGSTSWVIDAIVKAGQDPTNSFWLTPTDSNPIDYLLSLQNGDGSFNYTATANTSALWMTAYAIPALMGKPYPVVVLSPPQESQPPTAVALYDPESITAATLELTWSRNSDVDFSKYEIHKSTLLDFSQTASTLTATLLSRFDTSYMVTNLSANTTYYFKVRVIDTEDLYADSNEVYGTTLKPSTYDDMLSSDGSTISENLALIIILFAALAALIALAILILKRRREAK